jgi:pimeloyl-ACP methyl ester carboxylesterase
VLLLCSVALGLGCANQLVLPPIPSVKWDGAERRTFPFSDHTVEYFVARSRNEEPRAFVLRLTGDAAGSAKFTASRWKDHPVEVWVVNYPGYGRSNGPRTLKQLARVALASFDEMKKVAGGKPIFLEGVSLATTPALCIAARRPVAGVILQNPPALQQVILGQHGWWNIWLIAGPVALQIPRELDSLANANLARAPAVFLLAENDSVVHPKYQRQIFDAYRGPKRLIVQKHAGHNEPLSADDEAGLQQAMNWLFENAQTSTVP